MSKHASVLTSADLKMFERLRISPELLREARVQRVNSEQANELGFRLARYENSRVGPDLSGIFFPYLNDEGVAVNGRIRRDHPEIDAKGRPDRKYVARPSGTPRLVFRPPGVPELLKELETELWLVEAEKSALAIAAASRRAKQKIAVVAIGGCDGWRDSTTGSAIEDLRRLLRGRKSVRILLDSNIAYNPSVQSAELNLALLAQELGVRDIKAGRVPVEPDVNGPDDFLAQHTDKEFFNLPDCEPWLDLVGESYEAYVGAAPPKFVIEDILQDNGATFFAGLSGHGKSWILLTIISSLLSGKPLFGHFKVKEPAKRVIYLSPEISLGSFKVRAEKFGLGEYVKSRKLILRTLSKYPMVELTDPELLLAARGADVLLDTAIRFVKGKEESSTDNDQGLAAGIFRLLQSGARTIIGAHHSPKSFEQSRTMTLEGVLRGSGDIGAMLSVCFGVRQLDPHQTLLHLECVKARDFEPTEPFQLMGRPYIDEKKGLQLTAHPGHCGPLSAYLAEKSGAGRPKSDEKEERSKKIAEWIAEGVSEDAMYEKLKGQISLATLRKEIGQIRAAKKRKF
jgi:hypothetical protein